MDLGRINNWLQLAANLGLIAGLVLVGAQLRQNADIARAQLLNDYYLADMQLELSMMGENPAPDWVKAIYSPDQLTREEAAVVDRYFNYGLVQVNRLEKLYDLGLVNEEDWAERIEYLRWQLGNDTGKRWWSFSRGFYPKAFTQRVDEVLSGAKHSPENKSLLDAMVARPTGNNPDGNAVTQ